MCVPEKWQCCFTLSATPWKQTVRVHVREDFVLQLNPASARHAQALQVLGVLLREFPLGGVGCPPPYSAGSSLKKNLIVAKTMTSSDFLRRNQSKYYCGAVARRAVVPRFLRLWVVWWPCSLWQHGTRPRTHEPGWAHGSCRKCVALVPERHGISQCQASHSVCFKKGFLLSDDLTLWFPAHRTLRSLLSMALLFGVIWGQGLALSIIEHFCV